MRLLGIDYGDARTGVAASDPTGRIASEVDVIRSHDPGYTADRIAEHAERLRAERLVLGHPLNMDGSAGPRSEKTRVFANLLHQKTGLPVELWDERRTTVSADQLLREAGLRGAKKKGRLDSVAAVIILQNYLDYLKNRDENR